MTLDHCKGCEQFFSLPLYRSDGTKGLEYHCKNDCYCLIENVKPEKCIKKEKKSKRTRKESK